MTDIIGDSLLRYLVGILTRFFRPDFVYVRVGVCMCARA